MPQLVVNFKRLPSLTEKYCLAQRLGRNSSRAANTSLSYDFVENEREKIEIAAKDIQENFRVKVSFVE